MLSRSNNDQYKNLAPADYRMEQRKRRKAARRKLNYIVRHQVESFLQLRRSRQ